MKATVLSLSHIPKRALGLICAGSALFVAGIKKPGDAEAVLLVGFSLSALTARKVVISCVIVLFAGVPFLLRVFSDEH